MSALPSPPWSVAGTTVWLEKNVEKKTLSILVPSDCMSTMTDAEIVELIDFVEVVRERFARVSPEGWRVLA